MWEFFSRKVKLSNRILDRLGEVYRGCHKLDNMGLWTWMPCQVSQLHGFHCRRQIHFYVTKCQEEHRSTKIMFFQEMMNNFTVLNSLFQIQTGIFIMQYLGRHICSFHPYSLCPFYFKKWGEEKEKWYQWVPDGFKNNESKLLMPPVQT